MTQQIKEYHLTYAIKENKQSVLTNTPEAPFQLVKSFNEENSFEDGWKNMLILGDNLMALKTIYNDCKPGGSNVYKLRNKIKLIYIDPPFATKKDFMKDREKAYSDKVKGAEFIEFLRKRLILLREILADDGTIYVHLDWKKGHYIKVILDEIFGEENFLNEIIWKYFGPTSTSDNFPRKHENIFIYTKNIGKQYFDSSATYIDYDIKAVRRYDKIDEDGKRYKLYNEKDGTVRKAYMKEGKPTDVFNIPFVQGTSNEKENYPTQKPEKLLERIIEASSKNNDIILDAFAGSGSSLTVAEKLNRKWIGIDCGKLSIYTIQKRMLSLNNFIGSAKEDKRDVIERTENKEDLFKSKSILYINENTRKNELVITEDYLIKLYNFLIDTSNLTEFSIACQENKFKISKYTEDDNGVKLVKIGKITFKISFIEKKRGKEKGKFLQSKSFNVYNSGIYDASEILKMNWDEYRDFVLKLFEVRDLKHTINGFEVDGYIGVNSAYLWNYPEKKKMILDYEYVKSLHNILGGKAGNDFYFIAPTGAFNFMEDELKLGNTIYHFLKVPVSVLIRLIQKKEYSSYKQPQSEKDINDFTSAIGFDFISQPLVKYKLFKKIDKTELFRKTKYVIKLIEFKSDGLLYSPEDFENFETFSMILCDYDYDGINFIIDDIFWAADIVKEDDVFIEFDSSKWKKDKLMVIFIDIYGNEKKLIYSKKDFKKSNK